MISHPEAIDELFAHFLSYWKTNTLDIVDKVPTVYWQGVAYDEKDLPQEPWCRISYSVVTTSQTGLRNENLKRRYTESGVVTLQLFVPKSYEIGFKTCEKLAQVGKNAFRNRSRNIWFKNAKLDPLPAETSFFRFNVTSEYEFDEVQ